MKLKPCDSCGGALTEGKGDGDVFFVARIQITKGTPWSQAERDALDRVLKNEGTTSRLGKALATVEPAEIIGDLVPAFVTHADLRICSRCVESGVSRNVNLLEMIRAAELGGSGVSSPKTT